MVLTNALLFAVAYTLVCVRFAALSIALFTALSTALATVFSAALSLPVPLHVPLQYSPRQQTPPTWPHYNNQARSTGDLSRSLSSSSRFG